MTTANRGRPFETLIYLSAEMYKRKNQALIDKIPNAWVVQRAGKKIVSAYPEKKSTVDFVGMLANGRPIAIEAKSTVERTRFPLAMLQQHQLDYLVRFHEMGGLGFVLVEFSKLREVYRLPIEFVVKYIEKMAAGGPKSIPYEEITADCDLIRSENGVHLHFLKNIL